MSPLMQVCGCGCGSIVEQGQRCAASKRADNQRRKQKSKDHGLTSSWWPYLRSQVLRRGGYRCEWVEDDGQYEGRRCPAKATIADFIPGGVHTQNLDDYQALCHYHSGVKDGPRSRRSAE